MYSMQRTIPVPRQPTLPNVPWRVGQWNASRDGFFDLDERLASSSLFAASGLHLPLAPQSIFMPDYPVLNHSVVELVGYQERWVRERFLKLFRTGCGHRPQPHRPDAHGPSRGSGDFLFVDSGSNEGTWSLLAAAHGCKVISIDPQQLCIDLLTAAADRSGLSHAIETHRAIIAPLAMHRGELMVPIDQCHGTAEFKAALNEVSDVTREGRQYLRRKTVRVPVSPTSMDALIGSGRSVSLWHLDVEGAEVPVLLSAARLFRERRVRRVLLEFIPMRCTLRTYYPASPHVRRCHITYPMHSIHVLAGPAQKVVQAEALPKLAALFAGWQCAVVCPEVRIHSTDGRAPPTMPLYHCLH